MKLEANGKVGLWTLVSDLGDRWLCVCDCGTTRNVLTYNLRERKTGSCGCQRFTTHRKQMNKAFKPKSDVVR